MARLLIFIALVCFTNSVLAAQSYTPYKHLLPEHRSYLVPRKLVEELPLSNYDFHIVPSDQYPVAEYDDLRGSLALTDVISLPRPITALVNIASKALSIGGWLLSNSGFIIFGAALIIGFCAFTPYCTLTIESPLTSQIRSLNIPFLDDVENFFRQAYEKYHK